VRILIVKLGSIGDIVHTLPALALIRRNVSAAEISWVAETRSAEILRGNPMIDRLIEIDTRSIRGQSVDEMLKSLRTQVSELRKTKYDVTIDFQGLIKSAVIAKLSGAKKRWGFDRRGLREPASRLLLTDVVNVGPRQHVVLKNLKLARAALGLTQQAETLEFPIAVSPDHVEEVRSIIARTGSRFAVLNPGGGWVTKLWSARKYGELADRLWSELGLASVLVSAPGEVELSEMSAASSRSGKMISAQPTLKGLYELTREATVYVGGDTGPTHIAISAGTPVVGIFGPTEWWRNGSLNPRDICVGREDIGCRVDCHRRTCSNWICMDISVDQVFAAVKERVAAEILTV
jgi:heptosyltransferase-1